MYTQIPVLSLRWVSLSLRGEEVVYPDSGVKPKGGKPKPKGGRRLYTQIPVLSLSGVSLSLRGGGGCIP